MVCNHCHFCIITSSAAPMMPLCCSKMGHKLCLPGFIGTEHQNFATLSKAPRNPRFLELITKSGFGFSQTNITHTSTRFYNKPVFFLGQSHTAPVHIYTTALFLCLSHRGISTIALRLLIYNLLTPYTY